MTEADVRRYDIARDSRLNRDLNEMSEHLDALQPLLRRLSRYTGADIYSQWHRAGVTPDEHDVRAEAHSEMFDIIGEEASGFRWAVNCFQATVVTHLMHRDDTERRGAPDDVDEVEEGDDDEADDEDEDDEDDEDVIELVEPVPPPSTPALRPLPTPGPRELAGFHRAMRTGDANGVRVAGDWFRDRGEAEAGDLLDVLAFEIDTRCNEARQVRWVLDRLTSLPPVGFRQGLSEVNEFLAKLGLPATVRCWGDAFLVVVPNDGEHDDACTQDRLQVILHTAFDRREFVVVVDNYPITDVGNRATELLVTFKPWATA